MANDTLVREQLLRFLKGGHAHTPFDQAVKDMPVDKAGIRPPGLPHSAWELLEHIRITQHDILRFSQSGDYKSPKWPEGYWPGSAAPGDHVAWDAACSCYLSDLREFETMLSNPDRDLYTPFPWGEGQNLMREALLIVDHTSYHLGQLILVRKALGIWPD